MHKRRIIPKLLLKEMQVGSQKRKILVTTVQFAQPIPVGDPVSQAMVYESQLADELLLLDLDSSFEEDEKLLTILHKISERIFLPLTAGGGIRTLEGARKLLKNGADKICLNTGALQTPGLISDIAESFGSQAVVVGIDYRTRTDGSRIVYAQGKETGKDALAWAKETEKRGAGEILLTSIDRDGMKQGMEIDFVREMTQSLAIPVIVSGGCGLAAHFLEAFIDGKADAVAAGTFFCFKDENPMQTRSRLKNAGLEVRLET